MCWGSQLSVHWSVGSLECLKADPRTLTLFSPMQVHPLLIAIAIYASVLSGRQSLPTPLLGHILSLALPILTVLGLLLPRISPSVIVVKRPFVTRQQLQASLLGFLALLDSALVTLASTLLQPELQSCSLDRQWQLLFRSRNVHAIKAIQDTLNCCGFKTTLDRPWPWPDNRSSATCRDDFGRDRSCRAGWAGREVRILTIWIVVGVGGLIVKVCLGGRNQL